MSRGESGEARCKHSPAVSYLSEPVSALLHVHTKLPQIDLAVTVHVELRVTEGTAKQVRDGGPR